MKGFFPKNKKTLLFALLFVFAFVFAFGTAFFVPDVYAVGSADGGEISVTDVIANPIDTMLLIIFKVVGWLLGVAGILFAWVIAPENITAIVGSEAVYRVWTTVRDFLNMFFILVLLFYAFATIFQIEKYNIKKILLNLVLMALLVNFSFPLARFIIDVSNVIMYHLLNNMFVGDASKFGATFGAFSGITDIMMPKDPLADNATYLLVTTVFVFILAVTLLLIAVLLLIRLIVLAVLVMLSPIGFVGNVIPGLAGQAGKWWDTFFKYAFSGPIMIFFLAVSLMMMQAVRDHNNMLQYAAPNAAINQANWMANLAFTLVPVIMLWVGIGSAQSVGIHGAGAVGAWGQKFMKGTGKFMAESTGVPGGYKVAKDDFLKNGKLLGRQVPLYGGSEATALRAAKIGGALTNKKMGEGWSEAQIEHERKKVNELRKEWKDAGGATDSDLQDALHGKDRVKARAAALEMAEKNGFGKDEAERLANYRKALEAIGNDKVAKGTFDDKVKEKHIKVVIDHEGGTDAAYEKHIGKMTSEQLAKQKNFHDNAGARNYLERNVTDERYLEETAKKMTQKDREEWRKMGAGSNLHNAVS